MFSVQGRKSVPGNIHSGPAYFHKAESRVEREITMLRLGKGAAKLPQAKQAGPRQPFLFHFSVWTGPSKSTWQIHQHRSQTSTVHMALSFWANPYLAMPESACCHWENLWGLPEWKDRHRRSKADLCRQKKKVKEKYLFLGIEKFHPEGFFPLFSWQCNKHLKIEL